MKNFEVPEERKTNNRKRPKSSRRNIQFDEIMGEIRKLKDRDERSYDRSSLSPAKEIKLIDRYRDSAKKSPQDAKKFIEKFGPKKITFVNQDYLHEPKQNRLSESFGPNLKNRKSDTASGNGFKIDKEEDSENDSDNISPLKNRLTDFSMKG